MTNRVFPRTRVRGRNAGIPALCLIMLAWLAPWAQAQNTAFRSTLTAGAGPIFPVGARHPFDDAGSTYVAAIAVGDDFSTVGLSLGYSVFGAEVFEDRGAGVSQFELLVDCAPFAPQTFSPYLRVGAGAYGIDADRSKNEGNSRRFGGSVGVGMRWSPRWHTALTLVATYHNAPSRKASAIQWASLTLELMRWME